MKQSVAPRVDPHAYLSHWTSETDGEVWTVIIAGMPMCAHTNEENARAVYAHWRSKDRTMPELPPIWTDGDHFVWAD